VLSLQTAVAVPHEAEMGDETVHSSNLEAVMVGLRVVAHVSLAPR
jgi:hypothetical protein